MKKIVVFMLVLVTMFSVFAQGAAETSAKKTIYVLGPTPDHGWTAQAGSYAQAKCE